MTNCYTENRINCRHSNKSTVIFLLWNMIICFLILKGQKPKLTLIRLKILFNLCSLWKCLSNKFINTRPILEDTPLLYGG